jgi:hypothetical protein
VFEDTSQRIASLDREKARTAVEGRQTAQLLRWHNGRDPADIGALADTVVTVGNPVTEYPAAEIDANPAPTSTHGVAALDALVIRSDETSSKKSGNAGSKR